MNNVIADAERTWNDGKLENVLDPLLYVVIVPSLVRILETVEQFSEMLERQKLAKRLAKRRRTP